jgi:hypothetical protein
MRVRLLVGIAQALRVDLAAGYLLTLSELIHASTFGDFLEMAQHLAESGYKDAAAVVAGATLEAHLRALCEKFGVDTERAATDGARVPKKANLLNAELAKGGAYTKLDQKSVTAWCDLRNHAAHGEYNRYSSEQVELMLAGIRDFIRRVTA